MRRPRFGGPMLLAAGALATAALTAGLLGATQAAAPAAPAAPGSAATRPAASIDPEADAILRAAARHLGEAKSFTFSADVWVDQVASGRKLQFQKTIRAGVRRP